MVSGRECLLHSLLSEIKVAEETDQDRENPARLLAIDLFDGHEVLRNGN